MSSRVGRQPITIPKGVDIRLEDNLVHIKGAKGVLEQALPQGISVVKDPETNELSVSANQPFDEADALTGTIRALLQNHITGVSQTFSKKLLLVGTGYRVAVTKLANGRYKADLTLGFSHPVVYIAPLGIELISATQTEIIVTGVSKQVVGQVAADIRHFREPEPYKGKGVRYADEKIVLKEVKKK